MLVDVMLMSVAMLAILAAGALGAASKSNPAWIFLSIGLALLALAAVAWPATRWLGKHRD